MITTSRRFEVCAFCCLVLALLSCSKSENSDELISSEASAPMPAEVRPASTPQLAAEAATSSTVSTGTTLPSSEPVVSASGKSINVYMYSEYIDPALLDNFKEQTGLTVNLSVYEATEDMMAKLQQAGGAAQYDVVVASDHAIPVLAKLNLIQPLDATQISNKKNVMTHFADPAYDHGSKYSLPYQWGTMGIMIDKKQVPEYEETWGLLLNPAMLPGNFLLIDSMRDMFAAALKYKSISINTREQAGLAVATQLIQQAKQDPKCLGFEAGAGGKNKVVDGTAALAMVYNGDAVRAIDEDKEKHLAFFVPKEGTLIWVDAMVIPAQAPNRVGAQQFINFILDPGVGAQLSNFNKYATPNQASLSRINPEDRANVGIYPTEAQMAKMEFLEDLGDATRLYDEAWTSIKAK